MKFNKFSYMFIFIFLLFSSITIADIGSDLDNSIYYFDRLDNGYNGYFNESYLNYDFQDFYINTTKSFNDFLTNDNLTIQYLVNFSSIKINEVFDILKFNYNSRFQFENYNSTHYLIEIYYMYAPTFEYINRLYYYINKDVFNSDFNLITLRIKKN